MLGDDAISQEFILGVQNQVSTFTNSFGPLLLLPFPDGKGKISLRQLEMSQITLVFFCECEKWSPIWKVHAPVVANALISRVLRMIGLFSLLLGVIFDLTIMMISFSQVMEMRNTQTPSNEPCTATCWRYLNKRSGWRGDIALNIEPQGQQLFQFYPTFLYVSKLFEPGVDSDSILNKGHQNPSMIVFILDVIQAMLGLCEPAMCLIRSVMTLTTNSLNEVFPQTNQIDLMLLGLWYRLHEWQTTFPTRTLLSAHDWISHHLQGSRCLR